MKYYKTLDNERKRLEKSIEEKEAFIASAPEGSLRCYPNGSSWRWYVVDAKAGKRKRTYISKDDEQKARHLAVKGLYENDLLDQKEELRAINMYLNNCSRFDREQKYLGKVEEYSNLLAGYFENQDKEWPESVKRWLADKYTGPVPYPERLIVPTRAGFKVRSKSERDIIRMLMEYDIPFKYEQKMIYGKHELYPDFTILSPATGKEILWEHNGRMDSLSYVARKLEEELMYYKLGYQRGKNMIVTYEENNEGIDELEAEFIIHHMILRDDI